MYINLTPHELCLAASVDQSPEDWKRIPPSGTVARVSTVPGELLGAVEGVALYGATSYGEVEGLPDPQPGVGYIVSGLVAGRCVGRPDVWSPGTGPQDVAIRNEKGHIKAVTRLIQAPQS